MQVNFVPSRSKYSQTSKKSFGEKYWYPLMHKVFRYQKLSETPKGPPDEFFQWDKNLEIFFVIPFLWFTEFSRQTDGQHRYSAVRSFLRSRVLGLISSRSWFSTKLFLKICLSRFDLIEYSLSISISRNSNTTVVTLLKWILEQKMTFSKLKIAK